MYGVDPELHPGWRVFADLNGDGKWERGEPTAITNARGVYRLKLPAGSYAIEEAPQGYWHAEAPGNGVLTVSLTSGQTLTGQDFPNIFARPAKRAAGHLVED